MNSSQATPTTTYYSYYPGCSLHGTAREYDRSVQLICRALGIKLQELQDWTCCGASSAHSVSHLLSVALPAHNLAIAEKAGLPLAVPCAACFGRLKMAEHELRDEKALAQMNEIIGGGFRNSVEVLPLPGIFATEERLEQMRSAVKKPLAGLRVASYYGCLMVRPPEVVGTGEDHENPRMLDRIVEALGAESVDWPFKTECCGAYTVLAKPKLMLDLTYRIVSMAKEVGADIIVAACPMCQSNLDTRQAEIENKYHDKLGVPVLFFSQLIGLALGLSSKEMELGKHLVGPEPVLKNKGIL